MFIVTRSTISLSTMLDIYKLLITYYYLIVNYSSDIKILNKLHLIT